MGRLEAHGISKFSITKSSINTRSKPPSWSDSSNRFSRLIGLSVEGSRDSHPDASGAQQPRDRHDLLYNLTSLYYDDIRIWQEGIVTSPEHTRVQHGVLASDSGMHSSTHTPNPINCRCRLTIMLELLLLRLRVPIRPSRSTNMLWRQANLRKQLQAQAAQKR